MVVPFRKIERLSSRYGQAIAPLRENAIKGRFLRVGQHARFPPKPSFAPIKTQRTFEAVCEQIRAQLAAGTLKTGDKLPAERELAVEFQVSRSALREALRTLEMSGIIRNAKGVKGGSFIQAAEPDRIVQAMRITSISAMSRSRN
jgi:DNA-binding transcriptional regulator YhcF (GntR family)